MFQTRTLVPEGSIGAANCDSSKAEEGEACVGAERFDALLLQAATFLVQRHTGAIAATRLDDWLSASRCHGCAWYQVRLTWNFLDAGTTGNGERS